MEGRDRLPEPGAGTAVESHLSRREQHNAPAESDPRQAFANWLITPGNPWFARNIVNRLWSWLMGHGIIHEADDIRPDNPAGESGAPRLPGG